MAEGDLQTRALTAGPRELASLSVSLNEMTDSLLELNRSLENKATAHG